MKTKKYSEKQLKEMPLTEISYIYMSGLKRPVGFNKLVDVAFTTAGLSEADRISKLGQFYTDLTIDGRFVTFSNGKWDLRYRHRFEAFDWEEELQDDTEDFDEEALEETKEIALELDDTFDETEEKIDVEKIIKHVSTDEFDNME